MLRAPSLFNHCPPLPHYTATIGPYYWLNQWHLSWMWCFLCKHIFKRMRFSLCRFIQLLWVYYPWTGDRGGRIPLRVALHGAVYIVNGEGLDTAIFVSNEFFASRRRQNCFCPTAISHSHSAIVSLQSTLILTSLKCNIKSLSSVFFNAMWSECVMNEKRISLTLKH